ncbi:MAG: nitrite/sulfite reductase [Saprospiraceae bacterium]|nr:nitrite/sulfite reductase [Saprospiraceae bacterium]
MTATTNQQIPTPAKRDIEELSHKIDQFQTGKMHEERFRHYRLTRGVYGQRQVGVQMFRTKIPYGKVTANQLKVIAELADLYGNQNLHITTRQNIQLHFVKLEDSPKIWTALAESGLTARGACGNTVRNITASAKAGIDPDEAFDVTPYAHQMFEYFLRHAVGQDMGRKIKIAFSSSEKDSAYTYFHDFGFIPRIRGNNGTTERGFKVVVGGGLGAQSLVAQTVSEFMPTNQILPFVEAALRVFDRHGERQKRQKARMKFLVKKLGLDNFMELVDQEMQGLAVQTMEIDGASAPPVLPRINGQAISEPIDEAYQTWLDTNAFEQKQKGYFGVFVKVTLGNLTPTTAMGLADLVSKTADDDIRFTVDQNLLIRFVSKETLPFLYQGLKELDLADPGRASIADVTACPGTDTCALGVTNSTGLATTIQDLIRDEFPSLVKEKDIEIKISGCMNSCGQHMAASIGFHGSSIKKGLQIIPAMQVVLGGGVDPLTGMGGVADKVIKLPTRRVPEAIRTLLNDYHENREENSYFHYYQRQGKAYFYNLLKHLGQSESVEAFEFFDWGQDSRYIQSIGVGECAGVSYDMVGAILGDAIEKIEEADAARNEKLFTESRYHAYTGMVIAAKAWLLSNDVACNTQMKIIEDFNEHAVISGSFALDGDFKKLVLQVRDAVEDAATICKYVDVAKAFVRRVIKDRESVLEGATDKLVIGDYYKA